MCLRVCRPLICDPVGVSPRGSYTFKLPKCVLQVTVRDIDTSHDPRQTNAIEATEPACLLDLTYHTYYSHKVVRYSK